MCIRNVNTNFLVLWNVAFPRLAVAHVNIPCPMYFLSKCITIEVFSF